MMGSSFSLSLSLPPPSPKAQPCWWVQVQKKVDPSKQFYLITTAASHRLGLLLRSFFQNLSDLCRVPGSNDLWLKQAFQLNGIYPSQLGNDNFSSKYSSCFCLFNGREPSKGFGTPGKRKSGKSRMPSYNGRTWTNILLGINVLVYAAQLASQGNLLSWGAKVNSLIDKGQLWRLITASFLHVNIAHLMVNCYSLNSIGPTIENFSGPRRFLAVYVASAVAGSAASYRFCKAPSIGASGAIFGLVGSLAVFVIRHRDMTGGGKEELQHIAQVILFNMMIGSLFKGIDNWGHLGGLVGGAAASWLVGPAWKYEALSNNGRRRRIVVDEAPIRFITKRKNGT